jgi:hypothetical protein
MVNYKRKNNNSNIIIEPFPKRLKYSNERNFNYKILKKKKIEKKPNDYIDTNIKKNKIIEEDYINPYYLDYF